MLVVLVVTIYVAITGARKYEKQAQKWLTFMAPLICSQLATAAKKARFTRRAKVSVSLEETSGFVHSNVRHRSNQRRRYKVRKRKTID